MLKTVEKPNADACILSKQVPRIQKSPEQRHRLRQRVHRSGDPRDRPLDRLRPVKAGQHSVCLRGYTTLPADHVHVRPSRRHQHGTGDGLPLGEEDVCLGEYLVEDGPGPRGSQEAICGPQR